MAVLAHPDDESFGMGGTLALYAQRGAAVHLVCATRGEAGDAPPELMKDYASVADLRVAELRCAAGVLGLAGVHFLDYRDSGMSGSLDNEHPQALARAAPEEVAGRVAHLMRQLKPQVVLTFDPIGGYMHPDHIAAHRAAVRAFQLAGEASFEDGLAPYRPQKLYYHVFPKRMLRLAVTLMPLFGMHPRRFGRNQDIDLLAIVRQGDFPVHAVIDCRRVAAQRQEAAACHASQLPGSLAQTRRSPGQRLLNALQSWFNHTEQFTRGCPTAQNGGRFEVFSRWQRPENDLFAGL